MIVTEQVQDAVNGEETDLGLQRMSGKTSLTPGDGHTHDDVAVVPEAALLLDGPVGERENVRRRPIPGVPAVEAAHLGLPFQNHGQPSAAGALVLQRRTRRLSGGACQWPPVGVEAKLDVVVHQVLGDGEGSVSGWGSPWATASGPG